MSFGFTKNRTDKRFKHLKNMASKFNVLSSKPFGNTDKVNEL